MLDFVSGSDQQMLRLEAKGVAHRERMNESLTAPICVRDVVNQLVLSDLCETIVGDDSSSPVNPSAVVGQMTTDACQARELVVHGHQVNAGCLEQSVCRNESLLWLRGISSAEPLAG